MTATLPTVSAGTTAPLPIWVDEALQHQLLPADVAAAIIRLTAEFAGCLGGRLDGEKVISAVLNAHRDLVDCPDPMRPELVERSARQRLLAIARADSRQ
jgi:hypothetical protein